MKVAIEDLSSVKKKVVVNMPKEDVEKGLKEELLKIAKVAQIKGFRKGKAPFAMVEKVYMPDAMERYADKAVKESLRSIVLEHNFDIATTPVLENQRFDDDGFIFEVTIELHPKVELKKYKGLTFKKDKAEVTEEMVNNKIDEIRQKHKEYVERGENEACEDGDLVETLILKYVVNGEEKATNFHENIDLSKAEIYPEIREALVGSKVGEKKEVTMKMSDEKDARDVYIELEVKGIKRPKFPSDEELALKVKKATFEELKNDIKLEIEREKQFEVEKKFRDDMFKLLFDENPFEVPPSSIENLAIKMAEDLYANYKRYGMDPDKMMIDWNGVVEKYKGEAERHLKQQYLIKAIKDKENIDVSEEELENKLSELFGNVPEQEKAKFFQNTNIRNSLYLDMVTKKVIDFIVSENTVVEG